MEVITEKLKTCFKTDQERGPFCIFWGSITKKMNIFRMQYHINLAKINQINSTQSLICSTPSRFS